jgi:DOPA 4,5-dioxygenase
MTETITGWHAHVYYDPATTRSTAAALREALAARFPEAVLGRWHDVPVGPHPSAMYQVAFAPGLLPGLLAFLALNRAGLAILLHPRPAGTARTTPTTPSGWARCCRSGWRCCRSSEHCPDRRHPRGERRRPAAPLAAHREDGGRARPRRCGRRAADRRARGPGADAGAPAALNRAQARAVTNQIAAGMVTPAGPSAAR